MISISYDRKKKKAIISGDYFSEIREHFSVENPSAKFNRSFRFIPKRLYSITPTGQFDIGLLGEIQKYILLKQYNTKFDISEETKAVLNPNFESDIISELALPLRDYQKDAVNLCLDKGRGVCILGTGAGKTLIIASLIENIYKRVKNKNTFKCLVIVPDLGLVDQTFNDFSEYNISFTKTKWTGSNKPDLLANIIIANSAILQSKFEENDWLRFVDVVIVDECHKLTSGNKITKLVQKINTDNKFGFTGTLPESQIDKWNIIGKIGPVLIEKSSHSLREENFLTTVAVKIFEIQYNTKPIRPVISNGKNEKYRNELDFIYSNSFRNKVISTTCTNFKNNSLVLVNHLDHGERLYNLLKDKLTDRMVFFIKGDVEVDIRNEIKDMMEKNTNVVCIAMSSIFSTGVNIKNIHMILFASGGKSFIRVVQSIGRGLRLHSDKQKLIIIDLADNLEYGLKHSIKRKEIYNKEKICYTEHIIVEK
jgi:superfamily II DNA or RNA helicase